jgi:hypothetical protein
MDFLYFFLAFLGLTLAAPATSANPNDVLTKRDVCIDCGELALWCMKDNKGKQFPRPCATIVCISHGGQVSVWFSLHISYTDPFQCMTVCGYCKSWGPPVTNGVDAGTEAMVADAQAEFNDYAADPHAFSGMTLPSPEDLDHYNETTTTPSN